VPRRRLIARWLISTAAVPLAWVVAIASGVGWAAAAAVFAWTLASGRAVHWPAGALYVGGFVLAMADVGVGLSGLARQSRQSEWAGRQERQAARRARAAAARKPGVTGLLRQPAGLRRMQEAVAALPRPVRQMLVAGYWISLIACGWQLVGAMPSGFGSNDTAAQGQLLAVSIVMIHLIVWCWLACRTLSRRRGAQSWL
jgi:hypothetical protein